MSKFKEKYCDIFLDGHKSKYKVSNTGKIITFKSSQEKEIKQHYDKYGYLKVSLKYKGKTYHKFVHRLVAEAFIPNPKNKPQVNHKDGNKSNNNVTNLEWNTPKENIIHAEKHGLRTHFSCEDHPNATTDNNTIRRICELLVQNELTVTDIAKKVGVSFTVVYNILHKKNAWYDVVKDYDFSHYNVKADRRSNCTFQKYSVEDYHNVCKLLSEGITMKEITRITGVCNSTIQSLKYGRLRPDISSQYSFKFNGKKEK